MRYQNTCGRNLARGILFSIHGVFQDGRVHMVCGGSKRRHMTRALTFWGWQTIRATARIQDESHFDIAWDSQLPQQEMMRVCWNYCTPNFRPHYTCRCLTPRKASPGNMLLTLFELPCLSCVIMADTRGTSFVTAPQPQLVKAVSARTTCWFCLKYGVSLNQSHFISSFSNFVPLCMQ